MNKWNYKITVTTVTVEVQGPIGSQGDNPPRKISGGINLKDEWPKGRAYGQQMSRVLEARGSSVLWMGGAELFW